MGEEFLRHLHLIGGHPVAREQQPPA